MTASADRGLKAERVAEVIVGPAGGCSGRRGSGYLVSSGRVLTAAHVVEGAEVVRVRFEADRPGERVVEAAVEWRHAGGDVAVLTLAEEDPGDVDVPPVRFGRIGEQDAVLRCTALGFPRFKLRRDEDGSRFRDAEHVDATCAVLSNRREGTLDLKIASPPGDDPDPERDAWEGMSGAAVFSNGCVVGVVTRHHRSDGTGRIAASRVDRWAEVLDVTELAALEHLLGRGLRPTALTDAVPATGLDLIQEVYRAQLADIAPEELQDRNDEFTDLVAFCGGAEQYLWLQGPPWAGKTALAASFALRPPRGVVPVWFFITARYASQSDTNAYTGAVIDQLAAIAGREPTGNSSPTARDGERRLLLREAAERVATDGGTLLLVVDGLDEDQSRVVGGNGASIASLLPAKLPPNVRVLVTSRPSPGLPPDVGGAHPLRHCRVVKLSATAAARHTEFEARFDLEHALSGDRLQRDLVGLLTAARGTLTVEDLRELTGEPPYELNRRLRSAFGRILRLRGGGFESSSSDVDVSLYMSSRGYLFAHETLLAAAQDALGPEVDVYVERLHAWGESYASRGWPENTPPYLLQPYGRLVTLLRDTHRATALATDTRRRDLLRDMTGSDAACLAEIAAARQVVRSAAPDDLSALAALAAAADFVAWRNESLHPDIPAAHARLGRTRQSIGLARSVFWPVDRARALAGVANVLAATGDRRAVGLAEEALRLIEATVVGEMRRIHGESHALAAHGTLAAVLAATGRQSEALLRLNELRLTDETLARLNEHGWPFDELSMRALVESYVRNAKLQQHLHQDPSLAADLLNRAEESARQVEFLPAQLRLLAIIAEAAAVGIDPDRAARLYDLVVTLAHRHADAPENIPAVAMNILRQVRPRAAERLAPLALTHVNRLQRHPETMAHSREGYGAVCALVATDRIDDAQQLVGTLRMTYIPSVAYQGDQWSLAWQTIAEGHAREGRAAEAWGALEASYAEGFALSVPAVARVAGLLAEAGAAGDLENVLLTGSASSPRAADSRWPAAEALAALAVHFADDDPDRSLRLLHQAERGHHSTGGGVVHVEQHERLTALAGALATAGIPDAAERLLGTIHEDDTRVLGCAVVALATAPKDPQRALRLAEQVIGDALVDDLLAGPESMTLAVRALARAGAPDRAVAVVEQFSAAWDRYDRHRLRVAAAPVLWPHDPDLTGRWVDAELSELRADAVGGFARLLAAVGPHDGERSARIAELLYVAYTDHSVDRTEDQAVLVCLLIATGDMAAARHFLDRRTVWQDEGGVPRPETAAAVAYAVLGDLEAARDIAQHMTTEEGRSETLAHLAAYVACATDVPMVARGSADPWVEPATVQSLAALLHPPASGPDLLRARALLADALTPDGWHHAVPVLAAIDPDAVLRVRDVVFAHLGLGE
ncbi:serine protease [Streptomyces sp. KM273126]|uniref:trypsin-like peptidase domain-containing protein n=1 Tax=Streptomyces sp. KM273126 TaxID=2545247 RepID=UPI00103F6AD3|nr:trypsin-like peptidase domain-containing protein [Streptomyces sp. KM273126]MBA2806402.1 serine protease [Streptomyces sp. KM273126]